MENREFVNEFHDYDEVTSSDEASRAPASVIHRVTQDGQVHLSEAFLQRLHEQISGHLKRLDKALIKKIDHNDYSIYTGTTALDKKEDDRYLQKCHHIVSAALTSLNRRRVSFLCGDAGPLALAAVVYHHCQEKERSAQCLERLYAMHEHVVDDRSGLPDEVLYGRSGYLFAVLFVQKHLGDAAVNGSVLDKVYRSIIRSGERFSQQEKSPCPLMYAWHEKKYLGAAHGITGILHTLMQVQDTKYKSYVDNQIRRCVDYLMTLKFASGNYPSSCGNDTDRLVHWCHGAPGWIHMLVQAYKIFDNQKYLTAARECADVIWSRGLLRKGYGICHGVAGNAYAFLAMYKLTAEAKYLHRACKFAEWCFDYGEHGCKIPDRPWSLFEGTAGSVYFMSDLLDPKNAKFPAFVLY